MPKKYTRRHASKAAKASKAFLDLGERANENGFPKSPSYESFVTPVDTPVRLAEWLNEVRENPFLYSMMLQVWLYLDGLPIPKGVFKEELDAKVGRPLSSLGPRALALHRVLKTWGAVARRLVPEKYGEDPIEATKYVKNLAETAKNAPDFDAELEEVLAAASKLLLDPKPEAEEFDLPLPDDI